MAAKNVAGTELTESDDPIQTWSEDSLGRAALIDSLSVKLLISKAPVIALFGEFGSGKTSILNLLREHLVGKAIVVSFSTWLPGSQETLTSYLMADIANECQKQYMVPGLRKSAGRLANALAQSVPFLKGFPELFPAATQRDDIESLKLALMRLPKRVVVLLDELDRMERDELLPLVRGISALPNLSFVCAAERKTLTETVCGDNKDDSNLYFEKFFPSSVAVPEEDAASLQKAGVDRVISALRRRSHMR
jgi:AAA domain